MRSLLLSSAALMLAACASAPHSPPSEAVGAFDLSAPDAPIRAAPMPSKAFDLSKPLSRIVFGSCVEENGDQAIWDRLTAEKPDLALLIGDNVYGDVRSNDPSLPELKAAYMRLSMSAPFARLRAAAPVLTTWDDHDYGLNDAGADFAFRAESEALFDYVWAVGADDQRKEHAGVYGAWIAGPEGRRVQVILLDGRYHRSPLKPTDEFGAKGKERYLPDSDPAKTLLGADQWAWLAEQLEKPADVRLLVSSIQVFADGHGFEAWATLPAEQQKLYATLNAAKVDNLIILSGDRHLGGLYKRPGLIPAPALEATASSLNLPSSRWRAQSGDTYVEPDSNRVGDPVFEVNYGLIEIDWAKRTVDVSIRGETGATLRREAVPIR